MPSDLRLHGLPDAGSGTVFDCRRLKKHLSSTPQNRQDQTQCANRLDSVKHCSCMLRMLYNSSDVGMAAVHVLVGCYCCCCHPRCFCSIPRLCSLRGVSFLRFRFEKCVKTIYKVCHTRLKREPRQKTVAYAIFWLTLWTLQ